MSVIKHYRRLFAYDEWANREVLASLRAASPPPVRSVGLFSHIISAQRLWLERLRQQPQLLPVWPNLSLDQCQSEAAETAKLWHGYLAELSEDGLSQTANYKNTAGQDWTSRVEDVLMHVIMHSTYHRGQIAADLRAAGHTPALTDFIHAVRQGLVD
jgi:uncharacterized damage-inducible protein DinB